MKELDVEAAVSPSVSPYRVHRVSVDSSQRRNSDDSNVKNNMRQRIFTSKKFVVGAKKLCGGGLWWVVGKIKVPGND